MTNGRANAYEITFGDLQIHHTLCIAVEYKIRDQRQATLRDFNGLQCYVLPAIKDTNKAFVSLARELSKVLWEIVRIIEHDYVSAKFCRFRWDYGLELYGFWSICKMPTGSLMKRLATVTF